MKLKGIYCIPLTLMLGNSLAYSGLPQCAMYNFLLILFLLICCYSQFTLVTDFRASCFMSQKFCDCDGSVNWKIAVVRQKLCDCLIFRNAGKKDSWSSHKNILWLKQWNKPFYTTVDIQLLQVKQYRSFICYIGITFS